MSKVRVAVTVAVAASLLTAAALSAREALEPPLKLTVGRVALPVVALLHIAEARDYFAKEGLDVRFVDFPTGREALDETIAGKYDLAVAYTTPVVRQIGRGADLAILTTLHQSGRNTALVARRDRGIERPDDLRGKTIGVSKSTSGEFFLHLLLTSFDIADTEVQTVNVPIIGMTDALREGRVDAAVTWNPYLHAAQKAFDPAEIRVFRSDVYAEMSLVVGPREVVQRKQEAVVRFLRALSRAQDEVISRPRDARLAAARNYPMPSDLEGAIWRDFSPDLGLSHVLLLTLEQEAGWMRDTGAFQGPIPAFRRHILDEYLRAVRPEAVTLPPPGPPREPRVSSAGRGLGL